MRVDHGRLARAGRPDEGEEVGVGEVDHRPARGRRVKPSSSSRTGRTAPTPARRAARRTAPARASSAASRLGQVLGEQVVRACGRRRSGPAARPRRPRRPGRASTTSTRVGQQLAHLVGQAGAGRLVAGIDPQAGVAGLRRRRASTSASVPRTVRSAAAGGERHRPDRGRQPGRDLDHVDDRLVRLLAEVERERASRSSGAAHGARQLLGAVEVAERHVVGGGREGGGRAPQ